MDGYVTDFVELTQDLSKSWKHLAEFDTNLERRCKMHKRRIDMNTHLIKGQYFMNPEFTRLTPICKFWTKNPFGVPFRWPIPNFMVSEINQQFYLAVCRQIQYEIGETYTEMADLKISLTEHQGTVHRSLVRNILSNSFFRGATNNASNKENKCISKLWYKVFHHVHR